jgi:hypothetical protein
MMASVNRIALLGPGGQRTLWPTKSRGVDLPHRACVVGKGVCFAEGNAGVVPALIR